MTKIEGYRIVTNPTENESYYYNAGEDDFSQPILKQGVYTIKYEKNPNYEFYKNVDSTVKQKQNIEEVLKKRYINDKQYYGYLYKKNGDSCEEKLAKCEASNMKVKEGGGAKSVLAKQKKDAEKRAAAAKNTRKRNRNRNRKNKVFYLL